MTVKRPKLLASLILVGVFLLGGVTGSGATLLGVRHKFKTILDGPPADAETRGLVFALDRALKLDASQEEQVARIHRKHLPELNRIRRESEAPLAAERARTASEIRAILTPDQALKFDQLYAKFEARRQRMLDPTPAQP